MQTQVHPAPAGDNHEHAERRPSLAMVMAARRASKAFLNLPSPSRNAAGTGTSAWTVGETKRRASVIKRQKDARLQAQLQAKTLSRKHSGKRLSVNLEALKQMEVKHTGQKSIRFMLKLQVFLGAIGFVAAVIAAELCWANDNQPSNVTNFIKCIVSASTFCLLCVIWHRYARVLHLDIATGVLPPTASLLSTGRWAQLAFELFVCVIHSPPFVELEMRHKVSATLSAYYTWDAVSTVPMVFRGPLLILPLLASRMGLSTSKAKLCSKLSGIEIDLRFAMRAMFKNSPAFCWFIATLVSSVALSYSLRCQ
jgi:hypothetical protein